MISLSGFKHISIILYTARSPHSKSRLALLNFCNAAFGSPVYLRLLDQLNALSRCYYACNVPFEQSFAVVVASIQSGAGIAIGCCFQVLFSLFNVAIAPVELNAPSKCVILVCNCVVLCLRMGYGIMAAFTPHLLRLKPKTQKRAFTLHFGLNRLAIALRSP